MPKGKFCYECGSQGELREGMCEPCFSKKRQKTAAEKITVTQCSKCRRALLNGRWQDINWTKFFSKRLKADVSIVDKGPVPHKKADQMFEVSYGNDKLYATVHFNRLVCGVCGRALSHYYVATLQVRGSDEAVRFAEQALRDVGRKDSMAFFRVEEVRGGVNFKCGSKSAVKAAAKRMRLELGAELKSSFEDVTEKQGDILRRLTILARTKPI